MTKKQRKRFKREVAEATAQQLMADAWRRIERTRCIRILKQHQVPDDLLRAIQVDLMNISVGYL